MRLCPECRREYLDGTLIFCLDDGARLLDGPGANTEPATVLFGGNTPNSETPDRIAEPQLSEAAAPRWRSLAVLGAAIVLIGAAAFGLYRYISTPSAAGRIGSIAVMPFVNETGNPELEYLADGMTETLIASLGSLPDLSVKSRSSVFRYKGQDRDARSMIDRQRIDRPRDRHRPRGPTRARPHPLHRARRHLHREQPLEEHLQPEAVRPC
jgi:hypothetical protein